jgi:hypothetical protein
MMSEDTNETKDKTIVDYRTEKEEELAEVEKACAQNFERRLTALLTEFNYEFYPLTVKTDGGEQTTIKYRRIRRG